MALIKSDFSNVVEIDKRNMHIMNMGTKNIERLERLIGRILISKSTRLKKDKFS